MRLSFFTVLKVARKIQACYTKFVVFKREYNQKTAYLCLKDHEKTQLYGEQV